MENIDPNDQKTHDVLLNLTAVAFPVFGFLRELQERMKGRLPSLVNAAIEPFLEAVIEAVLLLPEEELKTRVLAMIPPGENEQAIKEGEEAQASVEALFQKARTFGERRDRI